MTVQDEVKVMARRAKIENHGINQIQDDSVIADILNLDRMKGTSTGYGSLDDVIGGFKAGACIVLGADTGIGKTVLGLNLLVSVSKRGQQTCYIDMENARKLSYIRLMAIWFDKKLDWFSQPQKEEELKEMKAQIDLSVRYYAQKDLDSYEFADEGINVLKEIVTTEAKNGVKFFLIDPLQSIEQSDSYKNNLEIQGRFVESMKNLAQECGIVVMILHHLRKNGSGGQKIEAKDIDNVNEPVCFMPSIDDFRGSNKITSFATQVWGMTRPKDSKDPKLNEKCLIRILKNREGRTGDVKLKFIGDSAKVTERDNFSPRFNIFKGFADSD